MKFKFVSPKTVEEVVGRYAPISAFMLAKIIEEALDNTNKGYVQTTARRRDRHTSEDVTRGLTGVVDKMLVDNVHRAGRQPWEMYEGLDFDIVHEVRPKTSGGQPVLTTSVNPYFHSAEYGRPLGQRRVVFHLVYHEIEGTQWSISFPVQVVMKGFPRIQDGHVGYSHGITLRSSDGTLGKQFNYLGITKRNWLARMAEHFNEVRNGSNKTFHAAWRKYKGTQEAILLSELIVTNHTYEQIMGWEEWNVDNEMAAGTSLNMIPGGFKGIRFLHEHRLIGSQSVSLEERDAAAEAYQVVNPRVGVPNLLVSQLWNNPEYAELVICGPEGRLSPEQVRRIREYALNGMATEAIVKEVGAKNLLQIHRVLSRQTYTRIG